MRVVLRGLPGPGDRIAQLVLRDRRHGDVTSLRGGNHAARPAPGLDHAVACAQSRPDDAGRDQHLGAACPGRGVRRGHRPRTAPRGSPVPDRGARPVPLHPGHARPSRPRRGRGPAVRDAGRRRCAGRRGTRPGRAPGRRRPRDRRARHAGPHRRLGVFPGRVRDRAGDLHRRHGPRAGHERGRPARRGPGGVPEQSRAAPGVRRRADAARPRPGAERCGRRRHRLSRPPPGAPGTGSGCGRGRCRHAGCHRRRGLSRHPAVHSFRGGSLGRSATRIPASQESGIRPAVPEQLDPL